MLIGLWWSPFATVVTNKACQLCQGKIQAHTSIQYTVHVCVCALCYFLQCNAWQGKATQCNVKNQWHLLSPSLQQLRGSGSTGAIVGGLTSGCKWGFRMFSGILPITSISNPPNGKSRSASVRSSFPLASWRNTRTKEKMEWPGKSVGCRIAAN